jgi:carboxypeptidase family protein
MHLRTLLLAGMTGVLGWVARGGANSTPEPLRPPATVVAAPPVYVMMAPPREEEAAVEADDDSEDEPLDERAGSDLGELLAQAEQRAELPHNAVHGQIIDARSGEALAGVTVVVTAPQLAGAQTVITDEHGNYQVANLPAGNYLMTFYYLDLTVERDNVTVSSLDSTLVSQRLDSTMVSNEPIVFHGYDDYVVNIPVGRTFEGVISSEGAESDNTYVVEDVEFGE